MSPQLEQLEPRDALSIVNHGGPTLTAPQLIDVAVGVPPGPGDSLAAVLTHDYTSGLLGIYGIQPGALTQSVTLPPQGPLTQSQIPALLAAEIRAGVVMPPGPDTLYMVYLPALPTDMPAGIEAYHSFFTLPDGRAVVYAVVPVNYSDWPRTASHEYAEATTDPLLNAWYGANTQEEIGDLYNSDTFAWRGWYLQTLAAPDGSPMALQLTQADVFALAVAEIERDFWGLVARFLPALGAQAAAWQQTVEDGPAYGSAIGAEAMALADQVFATALASLP